MLSRLMTLTVLAALVVLPAQAEKMTEQEKCFQDIKDARVNLTKTEDTGRHGEKAEVEAKRLFEIAKHLCEQGNFTDAKDLTAYLRLLLAD